MKKRILVADDSVTIQKVIALTFAEEPFEIKSVGTGSEAVERMRDWRPDLVLADVIMPQMNGYELCRAIKAQAATAQIPVILLAGTFEAFDEEEARACGADGSITKPFESGELIEKVRTQLAREGRPAPVAPAAPPAFVPPPAAPVIAPPPAARFVPPAPVAFAPPPAAPPPRSGEPDIWDILGDMSDGGSAAKAPVQRGGESSAPSIAPLQGREVVDFGSMEMGIGKPPSDPFVEPPAAKPVEKTKIESRERDFFGLEVEEGGELPTFEAEIDAAEEVSFEMAEPASHEAGRKYVAPPPAPAPLGEWNLEVAAPSPGAETAIDEYSPFIRQETLAHPVADLANPVLPEPVGIRVGLPVPPPAPAPAPVFVPPPPPAPAPVFVPSPPPAPVPVAAPVVAAPPVKPPAPVAAPVAPPPPPPPAPAVSAPAAAGLPFAADDPRLEALVRKIIDEKVEKIVWEVVPELAEVLIREAIEKLKKGG